MTTTVSTDPADHSINLDAYTPLTIEPADMQERCNGCYSQYRTGEWRLALTEARNRHDLTFTLCRPCVQAVAASATQFPATPAPWVEY